MGGEGNKLAKTRTAVEKQHERRERVWKAKEQGVEPDPDVLSHREGSEHDLKYKRHDAFAAAVAAPFLGRTLADDTPGGSRWFFPLCVRQRDAVARFFTRLRRSAAVSFNHFVWTARRRHA